MDLQSLLDRFDLLVDTPGSVPKLQQFILQLAVKGHLAKQRGDDEPADILLERIHTQKQDLYAAGKIRKPKDLSPVSLEDSPFQIPENWEWTRFGTVCNIVRGITFSKSDKFDQKKEGTVACLRTANVQDEVVWDDLMFVDSDFVKRGEQWLRSGDTVISMSNSYELVGKVALADTIPRKATIGGFLGIVRPYCCFSSEYLYLALSSPLMQHSMRQTSSQTTNIANLALKDIRPLPFPLPPLEEQERIVDTVENLMEQCDSLEDRQAQTRDKQSAFSTAATHVLRTADNEKEVRTAWKRIREHFDLVTANTENLNDLRRSILDLAVQGNLTNQNPEDAPAETLLRDIKDTKRRHLAENDSPRRKELDPLPDTFPFNLPETWVWTRLDEVCTYIQRGKRPDYSQIRQVPVVSQKCVQWDGFKSDRVRYIDPDSLEKYQSYRFLEEGDLLWNSTGVGTVGRINIYRGELDEYEHVVADSHVTIVRPVKNLVLPRYIYTWIASSHVQRRIDSDMTSGSTKQTELNTSTVRKTLLPLPPLEEQDRIVELLVDLFSTFDELQHRLAKAEETRSELLEAALVGAIPDGEMVETQAPE